MNPSHPSAFPALQSVPAGNPIHIDEVHAALMKLFIGAAAEPEERPPDPAQFLSLLEQITPCLLEPDKRFVQLRLQPLSIDEWLSIFNIVPASMRVLLVRAAIARIKEDRHRAEMHAILLGSKPAVPPSES